MTSQLSFLPDPIDQAFVDRFEAKIERTPWCWNWTGARDRGYGRFGINGKTVYAHRVAYELWVAPLTPGLTVDHLCRNRSCVNPEHLEEVPNRTNQLRGTSPPANNSRKQKCVHGHPLSGENLYIVPTTGNRQCQTCRRALKDKVRGGPPTRPARKLTSVDVSGIRRRYARGGVTQVELGEEFGVTQSHISRVVRSGR
jgi:hypothetical protein